MNAEQRSGSMAFIAALGLAPHPEGGWFRETWRGPAGLGGRASGTAILYLLEHGQRSHWHRVDAEEIWYWHAGAPLALGIAADGAQPARWTRLGPDVLAGDSPQLRVGAGEWQSTEASEGWALVSCGVTPGFDFAGFDLSRPDWVPG